MSMYFNKNIHGKEEAITMYYRKKTCTYLVSEVLGRKDNFDILKNVVQL